MPGMVKASPRKKGDLCRDYPGHTETVPRGDYLRFDKWKGTQYL
jgi:hypothetical protein